MKHLPFKNILLVTDMDGTLLDREHQLSRQNLAAIRKFMDGGGLFTVATGRSEASVKKFLDELPINLPAITYNGAVIYDYPQEKVLWNSSLPEGMGNLVRDVITAFPGVGVTIYAAGEVYFTALNEITIEHIAREKLPVLYRKVEDIPHPWYKIIFAWDTERLKEINEYLEGRAESFHKVYSSDVFLELLDRGTSKGNALKKLLELQGREDLFVVAMGDNMNDVEMLKEAGIGIAVENAHDFLKEAADLCCTHHDLHAVSQVIGWLEDGRIERTAIG